VSFLLLVFDGAAVVQKPQARRSSTFDLKNGKRSCRAEMTSGQK